MLVNYVTDKLEKILDRETKITHEQFAGQIEARLGYGEGDSAKGPDMALWCQNKTLKDVRVPTASNCIPLILRLRLIGPPPNLLILPSFIRNPLALGMTFALVRNHPQMPWRTRVFS